MIIHISTKSADYWAGDALGEINLHQQWHRPSGCKQTQQTKNGCPEFSKKNNTVFTFVIVTNKKYILKKYYCFRKLKIAKIF